MNQLHKQVPVASNATRNQAKRQDQTTQEVLRDAELLDEMASLNLAEVCDEANHERLAHAVTLVEDVPENWAQVWTAHYVGYQTETDNHTQTNPVCDANMRVFGDMGLLTENVRRRYAHVLTDSQEERDALMGDVLGLAYRFYSYGYTHDNPRMVGMVGMVGMSDANSASGTTTPSARKQFRVNVQKQGVNLRDKREYVEKDSPEHFRFVWFMLDQYVCPTTGQRKVDTPEPVLYSGLPLSPFSQTYPHELRRVKRALSVLHEVAYDATFNLNSTRMVNVSYNPTLMTLHVTSVSSPEVERVMFYKDDALVHYYMTQDTHEPELKSKALERSLLTDKNAKAYAEMLQKEYASEHFLNASVDLYVRQYHSVAGEFDRMMDELSRVFKALT